MTTYIVITLAIHTIVFLMVGLTLLISGLRKKNVLTTAIAIPFYLVGEGCFLFIVQKCTAGLIMFSLGVMGAIVSTILIVKFALRKNKEKIPPLSI